MTDDIHKDRTVIGMIVNKRDSRITFLYKEDTPLQRAMKRIELERVKRNARRALPRREPSRGREIRAREHDRDVGRERR